MRSIQAMGLQTATVAWLALAAPAVAQTPPAAPPAAQPAPAPDPRARLAGTYSYAGGARERQALEQAIERTIADMNFITKPIARGRLRDKNPVHPTITIQFPAGLIDVRMAGRSPLRSPDNGSPAPGQGLSNEAIRVTQRIQGATLVTATTSDEGGRRIEFTPAPDGRSLVVRVTVTSPRLPMPLRYQLTYRR